MHYGLLYVFGMEFYMQIYIFLITEIIDNKNSRNHF